MKVIIDTNVAKVANGKSVQASPNCVLDCIQHLRQVLNSTTTLVLDDYQTRLIFDEYKSELNTSGQPGVGDAFLKWVLLNQFTKCEFVTITPDPQRGFVEFPNDPALATFDPKDRKFIAVAAAHSTHPPILQAVDAKWWLLRAELAQNQITIEFVCPIDIQQLAGVTE
jgi:predicted nucleic acid-binding protein